MRDNQARDKQVKKKQVRGKIVRDNQVKNKDVRDNRGRNSEKKGETHPMVKQTERQTKSATKKQQNGAK